MKWTTGQRQSHIQSWQQGSLTKRQYCTQYQIGYSTFCKWIQNAKATEPVVQVQPKFVELPQFSVQPAELTIRLPNGIQINCQTNLTASLLKLLQNVGT